MYLSAGGYDGHNQLGIEPTTKKDFQGFVDAATRVPFDLEGVQCVSGGFDHSVIIKLGSVFAAGNDRDFRIGSDSRREYKKFTEIKIGEEPISWAACGEYFTLYLTVSGKAILCHWNAEGERIHVEVGKKVVSVFAGRYYGGIIDEEDAIHILDKDDPHKPPRRFSFESPAVDLACCDSFLCALTSDGRVFANGKLNNGKEDFVEVSSLKGKIEKLSGYFDTCAALTSDGRVFICGWNGYGQFGNGKVLDDYSSFTEVLTEEAIKDVGCSLHTLFLTESNKILGCGYNEYCQLFKKTEEINVLSPIEIMRVEADQVITGWCHSFILSGTGKLKNPAKAHFEFPHSDLDILLEKIEEQRKESHKQREKIDSLVSLSQNQSKTIDLLMKICLNLEQQIESNKKEIQCNHESSMKKMQESLENNEQKFKEIDNKLDVVVNYINDLNIY